MKPNGKFKVLNLEPHLLISNYDLEAIRAIVNIAPQEAQWYHTVERVVSSNEIYYKISGLYIPEQYTSVAEVESDSNMMISFYRELLKEHGPEKTNEIMSKLTCWCHSHHNMGVSPSSQDRKQFKTQCENAIKDKVNNPQLMLIFNKKDQYYCQVFDPQYNLVFENIPMYEEEYDFNWIKKQAKAKFKKKVLPKKSKSKHTWTTKKTKSYIDWGWEGNSYFETESLETPLDDFSENWTSLIFDKNKAAIEIIRDNYKLTSGTPVVTQLKKKLKDKIDPLHLFILNLTLPLDTQLLLDIPKHIDAEFQKENYEDYFNELFETIATEGSTEDELIASAIFSAEYYQYLSNTSESKDLNRLLNEFVTAIESDTEETQSGYSWR